MQICLRTMMWVLALFAAASGCVRPNPLYDVDAGFADTDTDTDSDSDADGDSDTDTDTDTDSDTESAADAGDDCEPEQYLGCHAGNVHWFDSCDLPGELVEDCPDAHGECVEPTSTTAECRCLVGFGGPDCAVCEVGYQGTMCDDCAVGYELVDEQCVYVGWCGADWLWLVEGLLPGATRDSAEFGVGGLPVEPIAIDEVTGLEWRGCLVGESWSGTTCIGTPTLLAQLDAADECGGAYGGHTDWRLPDVTEALTLLDRDQLPAFDPEVLSGALESPLWTTSATGDALGYWKIDPSVPGPLNDQADAAVRCVRGGLVDGDPAVRFAVGAADGSTVIDGWTGLEWRRCAEGAAFTAGSCVGAASELSWEDATSACDATFAGYDDWFVPDAVQLGSLTDYCGAAPAAFAAAFPALASASYWSATLWPGNADHICLDTGLGEHGWCDVDLARPTFCVRAVD